MKLNEQQLQARAAPHQPHQEHNTTQHKPSWAHYTTGTVEALAQQCACLPTCSGKTAMSAVRGPLLGIITGLGSIPKASFGLSVITNTLAPRAFTYIRSAKIRHSKTETARARSRNTYKSVNVGKH